MNLGVSRQNALLVAAALAPWAFDFRARMGEPESWGQLLALLISSFFLALLLLKHASVRLSSMMMLILAAIGLFLVGSVISSFAYGLAPRETIAAAVPVALLFLFALAGFRIVATSDRAESLVNALVLVAAFSAIIKVVLNVSVGVASGVVETRYDLLPGANSLLVAMAVVALTMPVGTVWKVISAFAVIPTFLSATRSILISVVVPIGFASASRTRTMVRVALFLGLAVVGVWLLNWLAANTLVGQMLDYWYFRLVGQRQNIGFDLTADIRRGEISYMLEQFTSSFAHILFGNGIAAQTSLQDETIREMMGYVGNLSEFRMRGFGHNNYVSLLFTGGLLFGGPLLVVLLVMLAQALIALVTLPRLRATPLIVLTMWNGAACVCTLLQAMLASPMLDRASSAFFGLSIGVFYGGRHLLRERMAVEKRPWFGHRAPAPLARGR